MERSAFLQVGGGKAVALDEGELRGQSEFPLRVLIANKTAVITYCEAFCMCGINGAHGLNHGGGLGVILHADCA